MVSHSVDMGDLSQGVGVDWPGHETIKIAGS